MTPHRATYHPPTPKHLPLILAAAVGSWAVLGAGVYLFGVGFMTLLQIVGASL